MTKEELPDHLKVCGWCKHWTWEHPKTFGVCSAWKDAVDIFGQIKVMTREDAHCSEFDPEEEAFEEAELWEKSAPKDGEEHDGIPRGNEKVNFV